MSGILRRGWRAKIQVHVGKCGPKIVKLDFHPGIPTWFYQSWIFFHPQLQALVLIFHPWKKKWALQVSWKPLSGVNSLHPFATKPVEALSKRLTCTREIAFFKMELPFWSPLHRINSEKQNIYIYMYICVYIYTYTIYTYIYSYIFIHIYIFIYIYQISWYHIYMIELFHRIKQKSRALLTKVFNLQWHFIWLQDISTPDSILLLPSSKWKQSSSVSFNIPWKPGAFWRRYVYIYIYISHPKKNKSLETTKHKGLELHTNTPTVDPVKGNPPHWLVLATWVPTNRSAGHGTTGTISKKGVAGREMGNSRELMVDHNENWKWTQFHKTHRPLGGWTKSQISSQLTLNHKKTKSQRLNGLPVETNAWRVPKTAHAKMKQPDTKMSPTDLHGRTNRFADSCCAASTPRCPTGGDKGQRSSNPQSGVQIVAGHLTVSLSNTIFTVDKSSDSYERFKGSLHEFYLSPVRSQFSDSIFAPSSPSPVQGFGRFSERQLGCIRMTWKPSQKRKKKKQYSIPAQIFKHHWKMGTVGP